MYKPIEAPVEKLVHCLLRIVLISMRCLDNIVTLRNSLTIGNLLRSRENMW